MLFSGNLSNYIFGGSSVHILCTQLYYICFEFWVGVVGLEWVAVMVTIQKRLEATGVVRQ